MDPLEESPNRYALVFRPWTFEEARKVVKNVTLPSEDPEMWIQDMEGVIHSYRLDGYETRQAAQSSQGKHWAKVRGDYTGRRSDHVPYPYTKQGELEGGYAHKWKALCDRIRTMFKKRADYAALATIKQKQGEEVDVFKNRYEK